MMWVPQRIEPAADAGSANTTDTNNIATINFNLLII
jgi:hypothetical protein